MFASIATRGRVAVLSTAMSVSLIFFSASPSALADVIHMKDGSKLEGEIVDEKDGMLKVKVNDSAIVEVPARQVKKIIHKATRFQELSRKRAVLGVKDVEGRVALSRWCRKNFLNKASRQLLLEIIEIDPDHIGARSSLGFVKHEGQWVEERDFYKAKGFVKYRGRWIPKEEADRAKLKGTMKKRIHTLLKYYRRGHKKAVEASQELLNLKPKDIAGPLLMPYLQEKKDSIRRLVAEALGNTGYDAAALALLEKALNDSNYSVASQAGKSLWRLDNKGTVGEAKKKLVQSLFHKYERVRLRSGNIIQDINDQATIPYLIEALYLRKAKRVTEVQQSHGIVRAGNPSRGLFGRYNLPVKQGTRAVRTREVTKLVYAFNPAARKALRKISGKDFDYDKAEWFKWWSKEGEPEYRRALAKKKAAAEAARKKDDSAGSGRELESPENPRALKTPNKPKAPKKG
jgi:hypothetical protein